MPTIALTLRAPERAERDAVARLVDAAMDTTPGFSSVLEWPFLMTPGPNLDRLVIDEDGQLAAHAAALDTEIQDPAGTRLTLTIIGAVCTRTESRGRGYAAQIIHALAERAAARGAVAAVLWSDKTDYYERLGFHAAGRETRFTIERAALPSAQEFTVRTASPRDVPALVNLRLKDPMPIKRLYKDAKVLFALPQTHTYVAQKDGDSVGYVVLGKGSDFRGIIHEWYGSRDILPGMVRDALIAESLETAQIIGPTWSKPFVDAFASLATARQDTSVGLIRPLDCDRLRLYLPTDLVTLEPKDLVKAVFDELPFYVFGLDSM